MGAWASQLTDLANFTLVYSFLYAASLSEKMVLVYITTNPIRIKTEKVLKNTSFENVKCKTFQKDSVDNVNAESNSNIKGAAVRLKGT